MFFQLQIKRTNIHLEEYNPTNPAPGLSETCNFDHQTCYSVSSHSTAMIQAIESRQSLKSRESQVFSKIGRSVNTFDEFAAVGSSSSG